MAIIRNADQCFAAIRDINGDAPRASIQRVFHQFLNGRSGSFDHLACGDAVDRAFIKLTDRRKGYIAVGRVHTARSSMFAPDSASVLVEALRLPNDHKMHVLNHQMLSGNALNVF